MPATEDTIISLLHNKDKGMGVVEIAKQLDSDIRTVNPLLIKLQNNRVIASGYKKCGRSPMFFERLYFGLPKKQRK